VRGVIRLPISMLNITKSVNFTTIITAKYISTLDMPISINFTTKNYNTVIYNPAMNNY